MFEALLRKIAQENIFLRCLLYEAKYYTILQRSGTMLRALSQNMAPTGVGDKILYRLKAPW